MYTVEAKYNKKRAAVQIKILAPSKAELASSDSDTSARVMHNNKARAGVLPALKKQVNKNPKHKYSHRYFELCKKSGIP